MLCILNFIILSLFCISKCYGWSYHSKVLTLRTKLYSSTSGSINDMSKDKDACAFCETPKCNGEYRSKGCDGSGKIQGGIATVPLFKWWPIKVFRPCPSYLAAGYQYKREGQTMDQVLFSEPSEKMKRKLEAKRQQEIEEYRNKIIEQNSTSKDDNSETQDAAQKLLNDKFGRSKDSRDSS